MASEGTIEYWLLSDAAKQRMEREDPDEQRIWFAEPRGRGHIMHGVEKHLLDLFYAQGKPKTWLEVKVSGVPAVNEDTPNRRTFGRYDLSSRIAG